MALPAVFTLLVLPAWLKPEAVESLSEWVAPRSLLPPKLGCVGKAPELVWIILEALTFTGLPCCLSDDAEAFTSAWVTPGGRFQRLLDGQALLSRLAGPGGSRRRLLIKQGLQAHSRRF